MGSQPPPFHEPPVQRAERTNAIVRLTQAGRATLHQWDPSTAAAEGTSGGGEPGRSEPTYRTERDPPFDANLPAADASGREIIARFPHAWVIAGTAAWRCTQCGSMATGCPARPSGGACSGLPNAMVSTKGRGHTLWRYDPIPGSPFAAYICCKACGASGSQQAWQNLASTCPGKWTSCTTKAAWTRLNLGKHPHPRHGDRTHFFQGVPMP